MAEANDRKVDCAGCRINRGPSWISRENVQAIRIWRRLDLYAREIDTFSGLPLPLRLEAVNAECEGTADPQGIKWRVLVVEEKIYGMRLERFKAESRKRKSKLD